MGNTTNFGDVTASLLARIQTLMPSPIVTAYCDTSEHLAAVSPKTFPAAVLVWKGFTLNQDVERLVSQGGRFASKFQANWEVHVFTESGSPDDLGLFEAVGPFAIATAVRDKLLGFFPTGQVGNTFPLFCSNESQIERFTPTGGSGGMKVITFYYLTQVIGAV